VKITTKPRECKDMEKARLTNSILGWRLIPLTEGAKPILSELYGSDYDSLSNKEKSIGEGRDCKDILENIKSVARDLGIRVSACGNRHAPTLRLWEAKKQQKPETISVDLKWSCWSEDLDSWGDETLVAMREAFSGKRPPVEVRSSPRKEARYGTVTISKGRAEGVFWHTWDECEDLASRLGIVCDDAFREMVPYIHEADSNGTFLEFSAKSRTFEKLMRKVRNAELDMISADEEVWDQLCFYTGHPQEQQEKETL
jgi:hypothetical protein